MIHAKKSWFSSFPHSVSLFAFLSLAHIFLLLSASYFYSENMLIKQVDKELVILVERIQKSISVHSGRLDMALYTSDSETPHPQGSSGFGKNLYIITTDGFVVERNIPIQGFLDASNISHSLTFTQPQTITTPTLEKWRVLSKAITNDSKTIGSIFVSFYDPAPDKIQEIDQILLESATSLASQLVISESELNTHAIDTRSIHYQVSFEIINEFNEVLINNGRTPSFIDPSYVAQQIKNNNEFETYRSKDGTLYRLVRKKITEEGSNTPLGIVIVGESVQSKITFIKDHTWFLAITSGLLTIATVIILILFQKFYLKGSVSKQSNKSSEPVQITFNAQTSMISTDTLSIQIPKNTFQDEILQLIFHNSSKIWDESEFFSHLDSEQKNVTRKKVYDAILSINKKIDLKLIRYQQNTICINPIFSEKIHIVNQQ